MVKSARGRAARASTPDHHPWALRGQTPPPLEGGQGRQKNARREYFGWKTSYGLLQDSFGNVRS